jgi:hypothetical protein
MKTDAERAQEAREMLTDWIARECLRGFSDVAWGDWTEAGFFIRDNERRVNVGVSPDDLADYPESDSEDQAEIRAKIESSLRAALR